MWTNYSQKGTQKIDLSSAPVALKQWAGSKSPDFEHIPSKLSPEHVNETITWYLSLQPKCRSKKFPPPRNVRFNMDDYDRLMKVGAKGFFLVLMAISWIPVSGYSSNLAIRTTTSFIEDVIWLMEEMLDSVVGLDDVVVKLKDVPNAKKRVHQPGRPTRTSKRRKSSN